MGLTDFSQVDALGLWYKFVNFGRERGCPRVEGCVRSALKQSGTIVNGELGVFKDFSYVDYLSFWYQSVNFCRRECSPRSGSFIADGELKGVEWDSRTCLRLTPWVCGTSSSILDVNAVVPACRGHSVLAAAVRERESLLNL